MAKSEIEKRFNAWKRAKETLEMNKNMLDYFKVVKASFFRTEKDIKGDIKRYEKEVMKYTAKCNELFTKEVEDELNARNTFESKFKSFIETIAKEIKNKTEMEYEKIYESLFNDLYTLNNRVVGYVGTIVKLDDVYPTENGFQGVVTGTTGKCNVYSIWAGGYNIQRLHVRFLVSRL